MMIDDTQDGLMRTINVLKGLAHPLRLQIIMALSAGDRHVKELAELTAARSNRVSQHLTVLRLLGLIKADRSGGTATYTIVSSHTRELARSIAAFSAAGSGS